jgi:hypothetical protein
MCSQCFGLCRNTRLPLVDWRYRELPVKKWWSPVDHDDRHGMKDPTTSAAAKMLAQALHIAPQWLELREFSAELRSTRRQDSHLRLSKRATMAAANTFAAALARIGNV